MRSALVVTFLLAAAASSVAAAPAGPPTDALGRPLRDAAGRRVLHDDRRDIAFGQSAASVGHPTIPAFRDPGDVPRPTVFDALRMRDDATIGNFTQGLGVSGIHAVDVDGDALLEIVVGHTAMWYVLELDASGGGWVQRHFHEQGQGSTFGGGGIVDVRVGDLEGDGILEVLVLTGTRTVDAYDAATGAFIGSQAVGATTPTDLEVVDVEGGPGDEILVLGSGGTDGLAVYEWGSTIPLWSVSGVSGFDLAVGNVDADPSLEIAIATSGAGQVVDVAARATDWAYSTGFGALVDVADVDGDGLDEIAGCFTWGNCLVVDGDTRVQKWAFDNFNTSALRCADVTGDGVPEVGIGDKQWGDVHYRNGLTGAQVAFIRNPEHSTACIDYGDVDGDCESEVLWGAGYTSTGSDRLYVGDLDDRVIEWENIEDDGPMHSFVVVDIDADGSTEIVRACSESDAGYDGSLVHVTDLHHRLNERVPTTTQNDGWMITRGMVVVQADADPQLEYVMNSSTTYSGKVSAFDGISHVADWTAGIFDGEYVNSLGLGDVEGDGDLEVLVGTGREHTGADGVFLRILSSDDGAVEYQSPDYGGWAPVGDIRVADLDEDAVPEIVFITSGGVRVYDGRTRFEEWLRPNPATALDVADVLPGGSREILIGNDAGLLVGHDGSGLHPEVFRTQLGTGDIFAIRAADVDGDGVLEIVLTQAESATSSMSVVKVLRASDRTLLWTSPPIVGTAGIGSSLYIVDADDDGQNEICVSGSYTLRFFEHDEGTDTAPPSFAGVETAQGIASPACCPSVDISWTPATDVRTPPMDYEIHRGLASGFPVDATTLIGRTGLTSFRDPDVSSDTEYWYVVRAIDGAGNRESNAREVSLRTEDGLPPAAPVVSAVDDVDPCSPTGVRVSFTPVAPPTNERYDLLRDGVVVQTDVTSPVVHVPGNGLSHQYAIASQKLTCDLSATGTARPATDGGTALADPVITDIDDPNDCASDGVTITFTHAGFGGAGRYDVLVDGLVVATDVVSPVTAPSPDSASHAWSVRAVDLDCTRQADSAAHLIADENRIPEAPALVVITDADPCNPSSATLTFTHPGFPESGHYELWRDGAVYLSPVVNGAVFPIFDAASHDYVVRAVDDRCSLRTDSALTTFADQVDCTTTVGDPVLYLAKLPADATRATWTTPAGNVARYDAYVGTLAALHGTRTYDHLGSQAGVSFPDAPAPSSGCDLASGPITTARIEGLRPGHYLLVGAVSTSGAPGPLGFNSDGADRRDPAVDPRPPSFFCP